MKRSEETKRKISINNAKFWLGKHRSLDTRQKISQKLIGTHLSKETINKIKISNLGKNLGKKHTNDTKNKIRASLTGRKSSKETRIKISTGLYKKWQNPEWKVKVLKAISKANLKIPNRKEQITDKIIQEHLPNQYKLNLAHNVTIINGRIPDWINCNGQKKAINFNGIYWHLWKNQKTNSMITKETREAIERKPYGELGFKLLIIWEDELNDRKALINKIVNFK